MTDPRAPAFPANTEFVTPGLSKREWFAGIIMAGMADRWTCNYGQYLPLQAVEMADALIDALNAPKEE